MLQENFRLINEEFDIDHVLPAQMDMLLEEGWRHFGKHFFRYNVGFLQLDIRLVRPLRIRLSDFSYSKSQRKVLRKNQDLDVLIRPIDITDETEELFDLHKSRFNHSVPNSIYDFVSFEPASVPCRAKEISVSKNGELLAVSYFDVGEISTSGIYAMFDPRITGRSLGIFTMLKEIEYSIKTGREFYYQGYAYEGESFYDYKKRFRGTETFDWDETWKPYFGDPRED